MYGIIFQAKNMQKNLINILKIDIKKSQVLITKANLPSLKKAINILISLVLLQIKEY